MDIVELPDTLVALASDLERRDDDPFTVRSREAVLLAIATIKKMEYEREEDAEARASLVAQAEELEDKLVSKAAGDRLCKLIGADASATADDLVHDAAVWIETAQATIARGRRDDSGEATDRSEPPPGYGVFEYEFDDATLWVFQSATQPPPDGYRGCRSNVRANVVAWAWEHYEAQRRLSQPSPTS